MDYYLKFNSEAEANAVLYDVETEMPKFANIDVIGVIYKTTGKMLSNAEGKYPEMAPVDGWHVNVRVIDEDVSLIKPFKITPSVPVRVWG